MCVAELRAIVISLLQQNRGEEGKRVYKGNGERRDGDGLSL